MNKELSYWEKEYGVRYEDDLANNPYLNFGLYILEKIIDDNIYEANGYQPSGEAGYDSYADLYLRSSYGREMIDSAIETVKKMEFSIVDDHLDHRVFNSKYLYLAQNIGFSFEGLQEHYEFDSYNYANDQINDDDDDENYEDENYEEDEDEQEVVVPHSRFIDSYQDELTLDEQIQIVLKEINFSGFITPHEGSVGDKKLPDEEFEELKKRLTFASSVQATPQSLSPVTIYDASHYGSFDYEYDYKTYILEDQVIVISPEFHEKYDIQYVLSSDGRTFFSFEKKLD